MQRLDYYLNDNLQKPDTSKTHILPCCLDKDNLVIGFMGLTCGECGIIKVSSFYAHTIIKHYKDNLIVKDKEETMDLNDYADLINECVDKVDLQDKIQLYKDNNASELILKILEKKSNNRVWGCLCEDIIAGIFGFNDPINMEHDKTYKDKKIEIKTSTLLNSGLKRKNGIKKIFQYNSIYEKNDWNFLLLCNVDFTTLNFYIVDKETFKGWDVFKNQKDHLILNFNVVKDKIQELTLKNLDEIIN